MKRYGRPVGWRNESQRHYLAAKGISTSKDYKKWRQLVNMSPAELRNFKNRYGQEAGMSRAEARKEGIRSGRDSADAILRMRAKSPEQWTDADIEWMKRQNAFVARMRGVDGPLYKDGEPTRKLLALKIWGHDPEKQGRWSGGRGHPYIAKKQPINLNKYAGTWKQVSVKNEPWFQKDCEDVTAKYMPVAGGVQVVNTCTRNGKKTSVKGFAKSVSKDNRKLAVDFGLTNPFNKANYEIVKVNPSYTKATVKGGRTVWELER